jgi:hypothetical protein
MLTLHVADEGPCLPEQRPEQDGPRDFSGGGPGTDRVLKVR